MRRLVSDAIECARNSFYGLDRATALGLAGVPWPWLTTTKFF
jgi:hypothetical protein